MTNYFSFHLSSKMISNDCCIIRHELTDWDWIKRLVNDSIPIVKDSWILPLIECLNAKLTLNIPVPSITELEKVFTGLVDGDNLIVIESFAIDHVIKHSGLYSFQEIKETLKDADFRFIKYHVSYFGDDDKERLDVLEYIESSTEHIFEFR
jgi:hypothetical protein